MSTQQLTAKWHDYLFLTIEMKKFLGRHDFKMFFSLIDQREILQSELEKISDKAYNTSPTGKELLTKIQQVNQDMMNQFNFIFNVMNKRKDVSQVYESMGSLASNSINRNT